MSDSSHSTQFQLSWKLIPVAIVTAAVVYLLVGHLADADRFVDTLLAARWEWMAAVAALSAVVVALNGLRFKVVLAASGSTIGWGRSVSAILTVWPLVLLVPARANDLLRAAVLRDEVDPASCVGSVVAERFVDVQTLCMIGMAGCAWLGAWMWFGLLAGIWLAAWAAVALTVTSVDWLVGLPLVRRFETKFRALFDGFDGLRRQPRYLAAAIGVSALAWIGSMTALWLLGWLFGVELTPAVIAGLWPLALFVGMAPVTVGGLGTRDAAFVGLVAAVGLPVAESALLAATFGYGLVMVLLPGVAGIPLMVMNAGSR